MGMCNQAAEQEIQLIQQRYAQETMSRSREAEEMARGWAAMQGQQHQLAERLRECERELDRFRRGEHNLREELGAAQVSAEGRRSLLILEERSMIHAAEEISSPHNGDHRGTGGGTSHCVAGRSRESAAE